MTARATLPGYSAKYVKSQESQLVDKFLHQLKLQQLRLRTDIRMNPATKSLAEEKALGRNSRLLEALDRLSLYGFSLMPWPFRKDPLSFSILARRVPKRLYGDASDFQRNLGAGSIFRGELHAARRWRCGSNANCRGLERRSCCARVSRTINIAVQKILCYSPRQSIP